MVLDIREALLYGKCYLLHRTKPCLFPNFFFFSRSHVLRPHGRARTTALPITVVSVAPNAHHGQQKRRKGLCARPPSYLRQRQGSRVTTNKPGTG